jgi:hypothetical protein
MSLINVSLEDTFEQWRVKTNQLGSFAGDQASLLTSSTNLVDAINEVRSFAPVDGTITTYGNLFQINIDVGDSAELILDQGGNLTLAGKLIADVQGNLLGNANTATKLRNGRIISITGDATWDITFDGSANATGILEINPSGVTPGTYTKFTVGGDGRITAAVNADFDDIVDSLGYTPVSEDAGYSDPTWLTGLNGSKILNTSSIAVTNVQISNRLLLANGTAAAPSLAFTSDTDQNTGLYWGGADGYMYFSNNGAKSGETQPGGNLIMVGNVGGYSDIRLKKDIEVIKDALGKVNRLTGIYYTSIHSNERSVGVIAQDVQREVPELIRVGADGMLSVSYGNMGGLLLQAINELTERVERLEKLLT